MRISWIKQLKHSTLLSHPVLHSNCCQRSGSVKMLRRMRLAIKPQLALLYSKVPVLSQKWICTHHITNPHAQEMYLVRSGQAVAQVMHINSKFQGSFIHKNHRFHADWLLVNIWLHIHSTACSEEGSSPGSRSFWSLGVIISIIIKAVHFRMNQTSESNFSLIAKLVNWTVTFPSWE